ncbi:MAG: hypothetical protein NXI10_03620 [bacterium]|nr:hypothetical protein [bacterium]
MFRSASSVVRFIIIYVWLTMLLEIGADYLKWHNVNNMFIFHAHSYIEFFFITVLYGNLIRSKGKRLALNIIVFVFLLSSILLLFLHQGVFEFNSVQRHIEGFLVTLIICFFLYECTVRKDDTTPKPIWNLSWMLLLYFVGNLMLFALADRIFSQGVDDLWVIHSILNIMLNVVFGYVMFALRLRNG